MSDVKITIKGLAFCRPIPYDAQFPQYPQGRTQILFLHPPHHELKLNYKKKSGATTVHDENITLVQTNNQMGLIATGNTRSSLAAGANRDLVHVFNLHRNNAPGTTIQMANPKTTRMNMSYLYVSTADFFTVSETGMFHELWFHKYRPDDNYPFGQGPEKTRIAIPRKKLRNDVSYTFNVPDAGSSLDLEIRNPPTAVHKLMNEAGITHELVFDNNCNGGSCANDFGYYYELFDAKDPRTMYNVEIEESPVRERPDPSVPITSEAACNPAQGDPPCDLEKWMQGLGC